MPGFVIEYHRSTGEMHLLEFSSLLEATRERLRRDRVREDSDVEIVAVSAENRDAVAKSHSRYFAGSVVSA